MANKSTYNPLKGRKMLLKACQHTPPGSNHVLVPGQVVQQLLLLLEDVDPDLAPSSPAILSLEKDTPAPASDEVLAELEAATKAENDAYKSGSIAWREYYKEACQLAYNAAPALLARVRTAEANLAAALNTLNTHNAPGGLPSLYERGEAADEVLSEAASELLVVLQRLGLPDNPPTNSHARAHIKATLQGIALAPVPSLVGKAVAEVVSQDERFIIQCRLKGTEFWFNMSGGEKDTLAEAQQRITGVEAVWVKHEYRILKRTEVVTTTPAPTTTSKEASQQGEEVGRG